MIFHTGWASITVKCHHTKTTNDYYPINTLTLATVDEKDKGFCVKQSEWDEKKAFKPSLELDFGVCSFCQLTSRIAINMNFPLLEGGWNSKNGFGEIYRGALLFLFFFHLFPPWLQTLPVINKMSLGNGGTGGDISRRRFGGHAPPRWIRCFLQRKDEKVAHQSRPVIICAFLLTEIVNVLLSRVLYGSLGHSGLNVASAMMILQLLAMPISSMSQVKGTTLIWSGCLNIMKIVFVFVLDNCQWPLRERFGLFIYLFLSPTSSFWRTEAIYYKADFYCTSIESLGEFCSVLLVSPSLQRCIVFWVLFLLWAEKFFGGWHSECTVNRSNKQFHTEPCLCLLHHNNSPLSYSRSFGVSCCFNGLMHWAGQKQCFIVSGQNTTYQESKSI